MLEVLGRRVGEDFDVGLVNGPKGKATVRAIRPDAIELGFTWGDLPPAAAPIVVLIGLPRPQTARDILRDGATLGVAALHFVRTEKSERSYGDSSLWSDGEWQRHVRLGAEQAFDTRLPEVTSGGTVAEAIRRLPAAGSRLALDNYEATARLGDGSLVATGTITLAIGGERGWSAAERDLLRASGFTLVHLGSRVLRTESAVIAAIVLVRQKLGLM